MATNFKISDNGINFITEFEGLMTKAYRCAASVLTIGIGETDIFALNGEKIYEGMEITEQEAKDSFRIAIKDYENAVNKLDIVRNQNQFDALVSFCYNLGPNIFKGDLLKALKSRDNKEITKQIKLYNKAKVKGKLTELKGLTRRRKAEAELFCTTNEYLEALDFLMERKIILQPEMWQNPNKNINHLITKVAKYIKSKEDEYGE